jgi:phosphoglycerate dehydrogenase-like enzyme
MCAHEVVVHDPYLTAEEAAREGVELVSLETLFSSSEVVSLHTPLLPATRGWIRGHHLSLMKPGATFINTARGAVVNQAELAAVLSERPDLTAVLDVLESEPPAANEPLLQLPNVWIYPHLAGSVGREYSHLAAAMLEAFEDYFAGRDCPCEVREADMGRIA